MPRHFKVDARALISLGRDNARDRFTALNELIKNSYDAGADVVKLHICASAEDQNERYIRIVDNGKGMTSDELESLWLTVGYSHKRELITQESNNRTQTGEKGIGRLSADRIGSLLCLSTKTTSDGIIGIEIDWSKFEQGKVSLEKIEIADTKEPNVDLAGLPQPSDKPPIQRETGTELWIMKLRDRWIREDIIRLRQELSMMLSPLLNQENFSIHIENDIDPSLDGEVPTQIAPSFAVLILRASLDSRGNASYTIQRRIVETGELTAFGEPVSASWQESVGPSDKEVEPDQLNPSGPLDLTLYYIPQVKSLMDPEAFALLRESKNRVAGVRLFRDGVLVKPYGMSNDPAFDWLELGTRQTATPTPRSSKEYHLKPLQLAGVINITRAKNPRLVDVSGREGLVQNSAFSYLRKFVRDFCVRGLEVAAHDLFNQESEVKSIPGPRQQIQALRKGIKKLRDKLDSVRPLLQNNAQPQVKEAEAQLQSVGELLKNAEDGFAEINQEILSLRALSTTAIASAVFAHETQNHLTQVLSSTSAAQTLLAREQLSLEKIKQELRKASNSGLQLAQWGKFTLDRLQRDRRTSKIIDWNETVQSLISDLSPLFDAAHIKVEVGKQDPIKARAYRSDIESILVNLLINAFQALTMQKNRRIRVDLRRVESETGQARGELTVGDSGSGVPESMRSKIWHPLVTTRPGGTGTGLGLWIVDQTVRDQGGERFVDSDPDLKGARFTILLPIRRERGQ